MKNKYNSRKPIVDSITGDVNLPYETINPLEDFIVPQKTQELACDANENVEYFKSKLAAALGHERFTLTDTEELSGVSGVSGISGISFPIELSGFNYLPKEIKTTVVEIKDYNFTIYKIIIPLEFTFKNLTLIQQKIEKWVHRTWNEQMEEVKTSFDSDFTLISIKPGYPIAN